MKRNVLQINEGTGVFLCLLFIIMAHSHNKHCYVDSLVTYTTLCMLILSRGILNGLLLTMAFSMTDHAVRALITLTY